MNVKFIIGNFLLLFAISVPCIQAVQECGPCVSIDGDPSNPFAGMHYGRVPNDKNCDEDAASEVDTRHRNMRGKSDKGPKGPMVWACYKGRDLVCKHLKEVSKNKKYTFCFANPDYDATAPEYAVGRNGDTFATEGYFPPRYDSMFCDCGVKYSELPFLEPSSLPSEAPSPTPSGVPSGLPSENPSSAPSHSPSVRPSAFPSESQDPSSYPSAIPSTGPSMTPSEPVTTVSDLRTTLYFNPLLLRSDATFETVEVIGGAIQFDRVTYSLNGLTPCLEYQYRLEQASSTIIVGSQLNTCTSGDVNGVTILVIKDQLGNILFVTVGSRLTLVVTNEPSVLAIILSWHYSPTALGQFNFIELTQEGTTSRRNRRNMEAAVEPEIPVPDSPQGERRLQHACPSGIKKIELAALYDYSFCNSHGGTAATAEATVEQLVALANTKLIDACVGLKVTFISGYCTNTNPYSLYNSALYDQAGTYDADTLMNALVAYWVRKDVSDAESIGVVNRDMSYLFTGTKLRGDLLGLAYLEKLCSSTYGHALGDAKRLNDLSLSSIVVAHEVGHVIGAPHLPVARSSYDYLACGETSSATKTLVASCDARNAYAECTTVLESIGASAENIALCEQTCQINLDRVCPQDLNIDWACFIEKEQVSAGTQISFTTKNFFAGCHIMYPGFTPGESTFIQSSINEMSTALNQASCVDDFQDNCPSGYFKWFTLASGCYTCVLPAEVNAGLCTTSCVSVPPCTCSSLYFNLTSMQEETVIDQQCCAVSNCKDCGQFYVEPPSNNGMCSVEGCQTVEVCPSP